VDILAESAARITVLALGVAVLLRALHIRSPWLTHLVWTLVIAIMLVMPAFVALGPAFDVPILPARAVGEIFAPIAGDVAPAAPHTKSTGQTPATTGTNWRSTWSGAAGAMYVTGVALFLLRFALGWRRARAIRRDAIHVQGRLAHPACVTPLTIGVVDPVVILPIDWVSWDDGELSAVLAHEEAHVRRRDPLVAAIALLNRAIFWFHPLAWWLQREISRLSEQACDAAVISRGHDSEVYSSCLLRFARRVTDAGGRIVPLSVAMPGAGLLQRLEMLARPQTTHLSRSRLAGVIVPCASLVIVCAAATPTAAPMQNVTFPAASQARWTVYTSDHFDVFHNSLPLERVSEAVRDAEAAYVQLRAALDYEIPRRVTVILVPRDGDLLAAAQPLDLVLPSGNPARTRLVISLESLDRRTRLIVHELTHQFAFEMLPDTSRVAPFLIEGLAEHQRGMWAAEDLRNTRAAAAVGAIPSLLNLAAIDRHWAHAVFDFVAVQYGVEGVRQLLFALRAHESLEPALSMAFGATLDQFNQDFRGYVTIRFGQR